MTHFPDATVILGPLSDWFALNRRSLPWRAENLDLPHPDPYAVLVSELMLQQTQVATVVPYFRRWMERFPDPASLASASDDEIHRLWEGLGYYRRAGFLKRAVTVIADRDWPRDLEGLLALPGLGPYTAAAVASIAFQLPEPALDGNAFRVLSRVLGIEQDPRRQANLLRAWLKPGLVRFGPSRITQAVMELGATLCNPKPACPLCPMTPCCKARQLGVTDRIPVTRTPVAIREIDLWLIALQAEAHWLVLQPSAKGLLSGLWRWPVVELGFLETKDRAAETPDPYQALDIKTWAGWIQVYSHRKEHVSPVSIGLPERFKAPAGSVWIPAADLSSLPMGKRDQRLRSLLPSPPCQGSAVAPCAKLLRQVMAVKP
jgi:A/G-specific adenine glycosylase